MLEQNNPKVLLFCDYYLPGYKSGGGMRTIVNTVERLGDDFDFHIVCRDHDGRADKTPYKTVKINDWNKIGKAKVFYLSSDKIRMSEVMKLIEEVKPKSIYSNSFFSTFTIFLVLLRRFKFIKKTPLIVAPEGELSNGSMQLKQGKKNVYLFFAKFLGLYQNIIWKAASQSEIEETNKYKGNGGKVFYAPNMPPKIIFPEYDQQNKPEKFPGSVRLAFLSRIHPVKNLMFLLKLVEKMEGEVILDIYGPFENPEYVKECKKAALKLPKNVQITFKGEVHNDIVSETLSKYHFFCLPTLGESFGHIIIEALSGGCPILISDRTPWRELEKKEVGWDIPLENSEKWYEVLKQCLKMDNVTYSKHSASARNYAVYWLSKNDIEIATRKVFECGLSKI